MSEDCFSEESDDCPDDRILPETDEVVIMSLMKILSVTNLYLNMLNLLVIETALPLPSAVHRNAKLLKMEKVKNRKRSINMMNCNSKRTFQ